MGASWGTGGVSGDKKPTWLNDADKERTYATHRGWVIKHPSGIEEVLVAIRGLDTNAKLGKAEVTSVRFSNAPFTAGATKFINVSFDELVTVSGIPTITVTGSIIGSVTASYVGEPMTHNTLSFSFVVPPAGNILTILPQSIALNGGSIVDSSDNAISKLVISADAVAKSPRSPIPATRISI